MAETLPKAITDLKKIVITGPESTGKSQLSAKLADYLQTVWVPEYARNFLDELDRPYEEGDLLKIAQGQVTLEEEMAKRANKVLIVDTDLTVIQIWSEFKYGRCDPWITNQLAKRKYDLYLLTKVDLPWQPDPFRENPKPAERKDLFERHRKLLYNLKADFEVVEGLGDERFHNAMALLKTRSLV